MCYADLGDCKPDNAARDNAWDIAALLPFSDGRAQAQPTSAARSRLRLSSSSVTAAPMSSAGDLELGAVNTTSPPSAPRSSSPVLLRPPVEIDLGDRSADLASAPARRGPGVRRADVGCGVALELGDVAPDRHPRSNSPHAIGAYLPAAGTRANSPEGGGGKRIGPAAAVGAPAAAPATSVHDEVPGPDGTRAVGRRIQRGTVKWFSDAKGYASSKPMTVRTRLSTTPRSRAQGFAPSAWAKPSPTTRSRAPRAWSR